MKHFYTFLVCMAVWASASASVQPPCTLTVESQEVFDTQWKSFDVNNDGGDYMFKFKDATAYYVQNTKGAADDWIISPAVSLVEGEAYKVVVTVQNLSKYGSDKQDFTVACGTEQTVAGMTQDIFSVTGMTKNSYPIEKDGSFTATSTGDFYIGLHLTSKSYMGDFALTSIKLEKIVPLPGAATDLSVTAATEGKLEATLSWSWPVKSHLDGPISSVTGAKIYRGTSKSFTVGESYFVATVNNEDAASPVASWTDITVPKAGVYYYKVVPFNTDGESPVAPTAVESPWIGADNALASLTNVVAAAVEGNEKAISLSWDTPVGSHGAYVDLSTVAYKITRTKDSGTAETIEESWNGTLPYIDENITGLGSYLYTVYTIYNGSTSWSGVKSNPVVTGGAASLPYENKFNNAASTDLLTFFHGEGSTRDWKFYSSNQTLQYWGADPDSYAALPAFDLEAGKAYTVSFVTWVQKSTSPKDLSVCLGTACTPADMTSELFRETITNTFRNDKTFTFSVPASGRYYIALHIDGEADSNDIYVDDIKVIEDLIKPLAVTDATATAANQGAMSVSVAWTNPTQTTAGTELTELTKVEIARDTEVIATIEAPAVGSASSWEETITVPGEYSYIITPYLGENAGASVTVKSAWAGYDTPKAPENVSVTEGEEGRTITFAAVTEGVHEGYIDTEALTYTVKRNGDILAEGLKDLSYTDTEQGLALAEYIYSVQAVNGQYAGEATSAEGLILGDAIELPYSADFDSADHFKLWTLVNEAGTDKTWKYDSKTKSLQASFAADNSWAFTPPFNAYAGKCKLTFTATCYSYRYPENLNIVLTKDTGLGEDSQVATIGTYTIDVANYPTPIEAEFDIPASGKYHVAFHLPTNNWTCSIKQADIAQTVDLGVDAVGRDNNALAYDKAAGVISGEGCVKVYNLQGVLIAKSETGVVGTESLAPGVYVARTSDACIKFVK